MHVIMANSSARDKRDKYGRMKIGASIIPKNTFAAVTSPSDPLIPSVRCSKIEKPRTTNGRIR